MEAGTDHNVTYARQRPTPNCILQTNITISYVFQNSRENNIRSPKINNKKIYYYIIITIKKEESMPDYQFGFRNKHSTIEQCREILLAIEKEQYCTGH